MDAEAAFTDRVARHSEHPFVRAARDPNLVPGVYSYCDQWCMYCPATDRCLAYRCAPPDPDSATPAEFYATLAQRMNEGLRLLQQLLAADGRTLPELDALVTNDPTKRTDPAPCPDDPLERLARRYTIVSSRYIVTRRDFPFQMR